MRNALAVRETYDNANVDFLDMNSVDRLDRTPDTAILLLVFNRPDKVEQVINVIRSIAPKRLYVASDGPRTDHPDDSKKVAQARQIATNLDWQCKLETLFQNDNLGCRRAVSGAIDWFFEHEEQGIIIEDDCVLDPSFFPYADELLERFKDDERIMAISAMHCHGNAHKPKHSYFFSRYNHCWGWATWKRAWKLYQPEMSQWPALRATDWLLSIGNGSRVFRDYWTAVFDSAYAGEVDSWAYRWTFSCWSQSGLSILPAKNLVTNIGFGEDATHTSESVPVASTLLLEELEFPLIHPEIVTPDIEADNWSDIHHFGITRMGAFKRRIRKLPGGGILAGVYRGVKRAAKADGRALK